MRKLIILGLLLISGLFINDVYASDLITISPETIRVGETDIGKTYTITITNGTSDKIKLKAEEIRLIADSVEVDESEFSESALEIFVDEFEIEPGKSYEHKLRIKFISGDFTSSFPGISYTNIEDNVIDLSYEKNIPVFIQNRTGEYKADIELTLNHENITTDPNILVSGSITNSGNKFFEGTLLLNIYKNNEIVEEADLTEQIEGLMFPEDSKEFEFSYDISNTSWQDYSEYKVEIKLSNDINSNTKVASINLMFIPLETVYVAGGAILALIFIIFSLFFYKKKNNKLSKA